MNLLLVEDEPGIRDGLAAYLRLRGHVVHTAGRVAEAVQLAAQHAFDLVVSDWRLPDGTAGGLLRDFAGRRIVVSGNVDEVPPATADLQLGKPILPSELAARIAELAPVPAPAPRIDLPADVAELVQQLETAAGTAAELRADGLQIVARAAVTAGHEHCCAALASRGGDLRLIATTSGTVAEWRLWRDGRPDTVATVIGTAERWPTAVEEFAIDCSRGPALTADRLRSWLPRIAAARRRGRTIWLLNLPSALRAASAGFGTADDMPKRATPGPRLPAVLVELWS